MLGVLWALWHLPLLAAADEPSHRLDALPLVGVTALTVLAIVGYAFFYTFLWNRTRNIWLAILFHGSISGAIAGFIFLPSADTVGGTYAHLQLATTVVVAVAALALVCDARAAGAGRRAINEAAEAFAIATPRRPGPTTMITARGCGDPRPPLPRVRAIVNDFWPSRAGVDDLLCCRDRISGEQCCAGVPCERLAGARSCERQGNRARKVGELALDC